jgi:hypothetical protein
MINVIVEPALLLGAIFAVETKKKNPNHRQKKTKQQN